MERLKEWVIFGLAVTVAMVLFGTSRQRVLAQTDCDLDCLNEKILALTRRVVILEKRLVGQAGRTEKTKTTTSKETFVQVAGGSATGTDWTKVVGSEFWFDQALYGDGVEVTWQGWMENGQGQARLYDATNGRAVDGSEVSVAAAARASFYSKPLAIWRGQNQYYLQVRNLNAQMVTLTGVRLRIVR